MKQLFLVCLLTLSPSFCSLAAYITFEVSVTDGITSTGQDSEILDVTADTFMLTYAFSPQNPLTGIREGKIGGSGSDEIGSASTYETQYGAGYAPLLTPFSEVLSSFATSLTRDPGYANNTTQDTSEFRLSYTEFSIYPEHNDDPVADFYRNYDSVSIYLDNGSDIYNWNENAGTYTGQFISRSLNLQTGLPAAGLIDGDFLGTSDLNSVLQTLTNTGGLLYFSEQVNVFDFISADNAITFSDFTAINRMNFSGSARVTDFNLSEATSPVPEASSIVLLLLGLAGCSISGRRKIKARFI